MSIFIRRTEVSAFSVNPQLNFSLDVTYDGDREIPFAFKGVIKTRDGKHIAEVDEYVSSDSERILEGRVIGKNKIKNYRERERTHYIELSAQLSNKAIDHIENLRTQHQNKDVELTVNLVVKTLLVQLRPEDNVQTLNDDSYTNFIAIRIRNESATVSIPQSEWVQKFATPLGIGKFLLLELQLPQIDHISSNWTEVYERLLKHVQQMESQTKQGDWYGVVVTSRRFMENLLPKNSTRKEDFKQLFTENYYSDEGYNHLYKGIEGIFMYASKFIHDKDKQDQYHPIPVAKKEDAYLVYTLTISLVNLIANRINSESED